MKMNKLFSAVLVLFAAAASYPLEVNRSELESAGNADAIVFRNYAGPHSVINSIEEIRQIGSFLAPSVRRDPETAATTGNSARYSIIHAVDPNEKGKLDADILVIGAEASVDHIANVRRIISSYLADAYSYSERDADTIAVFVTVYNAVYRGNMAVFSEKYKKIVTDSLAADKAGISTDYREWPGRTQLVIPLSDLSGGLSTVDTSLISDSQVVKSLQGEDDKGIAARKDMVDIKEREADNATEKAQASQKKATEEAAVLKEAQKSADEAQKSADEAQKSADEAQKSADEAQKSADEANRAAQENPDDEKLRQEAAEAQAQADESQKEADEAQAQADEARQEAAEAQKSADEQAQKTAQAQQEAAEAQAQADKKIAEAQNERTSIAKDQQTLIHESSQNTDENVMYGLKNLDEAGLMSGIVKINSKTGRIIKESPVTVIRGRTVYEDGDNFVAIAGTNIGKGAVKLVLIDKEKLEIVAESAETLSELSVLVEKDGSYYCTIQDGRDFYIGKFNNAAENQLKSQQTVKAATPITVTEKGVVVTSATGVPVILTVSDLSVIQ